MKRDTQITRDTWITLRCKLGDPEGFRHLVDQMERPLLYYVTKLIGDSDLALDVLQELWVKVFRSVGTLREPAALRTWVYRIARGIALNRVRADTNRRAAEQSVIEEAEVDTVDEPQFEADEIEALHAALDTLDRKHREVLVLHFLEDLPVAEIAKIVAVPPGTVKSRIHYAKQAAKRRLSGRDHGSH